MPRVGLYEYEYEYAIMQIILPTNPFYIVTY
jgi:hypothetical protein